EKGNIDVDIRYYLVAIEWEYKLLTVIYKNRFLLVLYRLVIWKMNMLDRETFELKQWTKKSKEFGGESFDSLARRYHITGESSNKEQLREFEDHTPTLQYDVDIDDYEKEKLCADNERMLSRGMIEMVGTGIELLGKTVFIDIL
nr:cytochrome b245, heavy chain [Tanacetum cinerariifolium]